MNYKKIYDSIILKAKERDSNKLNNYFEKHHILPKSLNGSNKNENIVILTAREHFICHCLLVEIYKDDKTAYKKMLHAFMLMKGSNDKQNRYINSRLYEKLKKEYSNIRSNARKGVSLSEEQKVKISNTLKGKSYITEKGRKIISEKAKSRKRKPFSEEYKIKHSQIMRKVKAGDA